MSDGRVRPIARGRGAQIDPPNRFERVHHEDDFEGLADDDDHLQRLEERATEYLVDRARTVVSTNDSPDVGFNYSLNPYRGCVHGCAYCYARPTHEFLGFSAGVDFESKILVKEDAPDLFREFLRKPSWRPNPIALSGVTDPYQPAERRFRLTRSCLEIALEARQPISIITKNGLVRRDLDILGPMGKLGLVHVNISLTTLDDDLAADLEPRASLPQIRLRAMTELSEAGVPVRAMIAPIIPGLTDEEVPKLLKAARAAGATQAAMTLVRLPLAVGPIFEDWLRRIRPDRAEKVLSRIKRSHGGKFNAPEFGKRMTGEGPAADQIVGLFRTFRAREGLDGDLPPYNLSDFRPPLPTRGQLHLF